MLYTNARGAQTAFKNANGLRMLGRKLTVHLATSKKSQSHLNHPTNMLNTTNANESTTNGNETTTVSTSPTPASNSNDSNVNTAKIVHVRNFPETCSQQQVRECFNAYGEIVECLILHDSYAFVHFKVASDARFALTSTNNTPFMGQNLLVQYSRSKFKQQNATTTTTTTTTLTQQQPPQLMSTNLDENGVNFYNSNSNGFKRHTYTNNYGEQQTNMSGCISDGINTSRNNKMGPIKYQQATASSSSSTNTNTNTVSQSKSTSSGNTRSLSIENGTSRNKSNGGLIKKVSGIGNQTQTNTNNNTTTRNYKVALGLNLANGNGTIQKKSNENSSNGYLFFFVSLKMFP